MGLYDDLKKGSFSVPAAPPGTPPPTQSSQKRPEHTGLADLARGLQYVVNEAAMAAHLHLGKTLDLFFDKNGLPIYREVQLPDGRVVDVPLIALTPPANLMLDTMEVELAVRINDMTPVSDEVAMGPVGEPGQAFSDTGSGPGPGGDSMPESFASPFTEGPPTAGPAPSPPKPLERLSFDIAPSPKSADADSRKDSNIMDIKMVFKREESPEGVARLVALFTDAMFRAKDPREKPAAASGTSGSGVPAPAAAPTKK